MLSKAKVNQYEFDGHVQVSTSDKEVRVWVCVNGVNAFRLKALGKVTVVEYGYGKQIEVMVMPNEESGKSKTDE